MESELEFQQGDCVRKTKGYSFEGVVVSVFYKLDGTPRLVVEMVSNGNGDGMLHIFAPSQMEKVDV